MPENNYKNLPPEAAEILIGDDEKIRASLAGLKRVEAPKDFDFRVKARVAKHSRADFQPRFLPVLRRVLPLGLIAAVSAALVFNGGFSTDTASVPTAAESQPPAEIKKQIETSATGFVEEAGNAAPLDQETVVTIAKTADSRRERAVPTRTAALRSIRKEKNAPPKIILESSGGSRLSALTAPKKIITPPGFEPNRVGQGSPNPTDIKALTAKEVLAQLGVETIFDKDGWKVLSVRQNSPAERSGVKTGDAVQSIDGERLTDKPMSGKKIEGRKLSVKRGAERIEIFLNN